MHSDHNENPKSERPLLSRGLLMKMNTSDEDTGPYQQHFIGSGGFGKVFVNPKIRSRVVKIIEFDEQENVQQICENETKFCKLFSDQAQKLESQDFRLAPHVYGSAKYKIPRSSKHIICIESERFIGDLAWGVEHDRLFKTYLSRSLATGSQSTSS